MVVAIPGAALAARHGASVKGAAASRLRRVSDADGLSAAEKKRNGSIRDESSKLEIGERGGAPARGRRARVSHKAQGFPCDDDDRPDARAVP